MEVATSFRVCAPATGENACIEAPTSLRTGRRGELFYSSRPAFDGTGADAVVAAFVRGVRARYADYAGDLLWCSRVMRLAQ